MAVSIHAPARGAMIWSMGGVGMYMFQFTHPRGVRSSSTGAVTQDYVSIHAPARGAICDNGTGDTYKFVSIHAPARGAMIGMLVICEVLCFNSRTREGCDANPTKDSFLDWVSIHAPARGAIPSVK